MAEGESIKVAELPMRVARMAVVVLKYLVQPFCREQLPSASLKGSCHTPTGHPIACPLIRLAGGMTKASSLALPRRAGACTMM